MFTLRGYWCVRRDDPLRKSRTSRDLRRGRYGGLKGFPQLKDLPPDTLTKTRTYARADVPALAKKGGWPLVVMSPGMTMPRATLTSLAEEFASRGYVVAGIEHTYESVATTFPGGRTVTFEAGAGGQITRDYVTAFLDTHLKGERRPLLDGPSAEYPEVGFW